MYPRSWTERDAAKFQKCTIIFFLVNGIARLFLLIILGSRVPYSYILCMDLLLKRFIQRVIRYRLVTVTRLGLLLYVFVKMMVSTICFYRPSGY